MLNVMTQNFYEKFTGEKHEVVINLVGYINPLGSEHHYEVRVDDEFYSTAESRAEAYEEVEDIVKTNNWSFTKPM